MVTCLCLVVADLETQSSEEITDYPMCHRQIKSEHFSVRCLEANAKD